MQETIEKLLILQDRDRKILRVSQELAHIGPERESPRARAAATTAKELSDDQIGRLDERETNLKKEFAELQASRAQLASAVDESTRNRYERIFKSKGENVVVGVEHSSCGGCHMKLPAQIMVSCQSQGEIVTCPNCGRILYFNRDMDLTAAD